MHPKYTNYSQPDILSSTMSVRDLNGYFASPLRINEADHLDLLEDGSHETIRPLDPEYWL